MRTSRPPVPTMVAVPPRHRGATAAGEGARGAVAAIRSATRRALPGTRAGYRTNVSEKRRLREPGPGKVGQTQPSARTRTKGGGEGVMALLLAQAEGTTDTILWIIAAVLVVAGIVSLIRGGVMAGIVLIVLGLLVGPGGVSIFD